jgi:hypothetical protein
MHWRTFYALCDRIAAVEDAKHAAWIEGARALLDRIGWPGDEAAWFKGAGSKSTE